MRFSDLDNAVKHLMKTTCCSHCKGKYTEHDVNVILTTKLEGLFELKCNKCRVSSIMTVFLSPVVETKKTDPKNIVNNPVSGISQNDILDIKNFLDNFDGNFKKLFTNDK